MGWPRDVLARSESLAYMLLVVIFGASSVAISSSPLTSRTLGIVGPAGFRLVAIFLAAIVSFLVFTNRQHIWGFLEKGIINRRLLALFLIPILFSLILAPFYRHLLRTAGFPLGGAESSSPPVSYSESQSGETAATAPVGEVLRVISEVPEQAVSYAFLLPLFVMVSLMALWFWKIRYIPSDLRRRRGILELARTNLAEAVTKLERYDDVRQTILDCYRRMCTSLASCGYHILPQHTAKEFEWIVSSALPLPKQALNKLTNLFEEARYSEHSLGEENRREALQSLRAIHGSLPLEHSG